MVRVSVLVFVVGRVFLFFRREFFFEFVLVWSLLYGLMRRGLGELEVGRVIFFYRG